jgi:hypothetical protein
LSAALIRVQRRESRALLLAFIKRLDEHTPRPARDGSLCYFPSLFF